MIRIKFSPQCPGYDELPKEWSSFYKEKCRFENSIYYGKDMVYIALSDSYRVGFSEEELFKNDWAVFRCLK